MKPTDEQLREVVVAMNDAGYAITPINGSYRDIKSGDMVKAGRAAFEAFCKIAADILEGESGSQAGCCWITAASRLRSLSELRKGSAVDVVHEWADAHSLILSEDSALELVAAVRKADSK
jgi:hypothetical protein